MQHKTQSLLHSLLKKDMDQLAISFGTDKQSMCNGYTFAYESYFHSVKDKPIRILELGVHPIGGSIKLWEAYFPNAQIYGIDIAQECKQHETDRSTIYIGDLMDNQFVQDFLQKSGGQFDIIIDDASHAQPQLSHSLYQLFPHVNSGGVYIIEDLHTSYSTLFNMGYKKEGSIIEELKGLVDTLHVDLYKETDRSVMYKTGLGITPKKEKLNIFEKDLYSIHFYNGICFLFKS